MLVALLGSCNAISVYQVLVIRLEQDRKHRGNRCDDCGSMLAFDITKVNTTRNRKKRQEKASFIVSTKGGWNTERETKKVGRRRNLRQRLSFRFGFVVIKCQQYLSNRTQWENK